MAETNENKGRYSKKVRPKNHPGVKHGALTLTKLLKAELDGRLGIKKLRDKLEANLIDQAGGQDAITPTMAILIKKVTHKALVAGQYEKMALLEVARLDSTYIRLTNSLRQDIKLLEQLIAETRRLKKKPLSIDAILAETEEQKK